MRTPLLLLPLLVMAGLPGCLWEPECQDPLLPDIATPWVDGAHLYTDPEQTWDTLVRIDGSGATGNWSVTPSITPASWGVEQVRLDDGAGSGNFSLLRIHPGVGAATLELDSSAQIEFEGYCMSGAGGGVNWDLAQPVEGIRASPGQGVHVLTAGFWENGTLFYTNIAEVDQDKAWPKADWYAWEGGEPLPVYVYDQDRSEEPAIWHGTTAGTPLGGPTQNLTLWDYFTTIAGFNEALKGLSTHTSRVVRVAPEDAYTRAGNEEHPLYGDAIVFYIKVLDVVDLPCPMSLEPSLCVLPGPIALKAK